MIGPVGEGPDEDLTPEFVLEYRLVKAGVPVYGMGIQIEGKLLGESSREATLTSAFHLLTRNLLITAKGKEF